LTLVLSELSSISNKELSAIDLVLHHLENVIVSFFPMRNDTVRTVFDAVPEHKSTTAVEKIERAPAEETGLPFFEVMTGIKRAVLVNKILVVHRNNSSLGNFYRWLWIGLPA
jgi:hypothetical protein